MNYPNIETIELVKVQSDTGYVQFKLWPKQREAHHLFESYLDLILLKSRQSGFSTLTGQDSMWCAMMNDGWECMVLSVTADDAEVYLQRIMNSYETLDDKWKKIFAPDKVNKSEIIWPWGSAIYSLPANKGYGRTVNRVVLDEYFKINPTRSHITIDEVIRNVKPALDKRKGQLIRVGTADGINQQSKTYMQAMRGEIGTKSFFFSCWDDPSMTEIRREQIVKDNGSTHANQEYPRNESEAFLSSGSPRFETSIVDEYSKATIKPKFKGFLHSDGLEPSEHGNFEIYHKREIFGQYVVFADVSEGVGQDSSIAKVFDRINQNQVAEWSGQVEPSVFGEVLYILGIMFNHSIIVCEANNHGHSSINTLINVKKYPSSLVFVHDEMTRERPDDDFNRGMVRYGWRTTVTTRPIIINNLARMILDRDIQAFNDNDISELLSFVVKNGKAQAESGCHDDRVMVLCIAYYLLNNDTFNAFYPIIKRKDYETCSTCHESILVGDDVGMCQFSGKKIKLDQWCHKYHVRKWNYEEYLQEVGLEQKQGYIPMRRVASNNENE